MQVKLSVILEKNHILELELNYWWAQNKRKKFHLYWEYSLVVKTLTSICEALSSILSIWKIN